MVIFCYNHHIFRFFYRETNKECIDMLHNEHDVSADEWLNRFNWHLPNEDFLINDKGEFCKNEDGKLTPIANFIIIPLEVVYKVSGNDGKAEPYKYIFTGVVRGQQVLKTTEVLLTDLHNSNWIKKWNPFCQIYKKIADNYKLILDYLYVRQKEIPSWIEFDTIGWHNYDNKWFFLHGGGTIGDSDNNVRTSNKKFTLKMDKHITAKEAFLESLNMLDICDRKLTYSLLSFLLTSIVTTPLIKSKDLSPNYLLWVMGGTGLGKTTFSTFFTNIFTRENVARVDAHKTLELLPNIQEQKDCVFIVDDYGTSKTLQKEYSTINKVEDVIRELGDRTVLSYEGGISKGMLLITGERFLEQNDKNESSIKRIIRVKMDNLFNQENKKTYDPLKKERYNRYKNTLFLPTSIGYYLEWLSEKLNSNFIDDYRKDFETLRNEFTQNANGRYTDGFAHQIIAFNFYLAYGKERGFISPEEYVNKCNTAKKIFLELFKDQYKMIFDPNVELFLESLGELIMDGTIVVELGGNTLNFDHSIFGVVKVEKEREVLKLDWETVYSLVSKHIIKSQNNRNSFIGNKILGKLLDSSNLITFNDNGTTTQFKAWNNNNLENCRVINFKTEMIPDIMNVIMKLHNDRIQYNKDIQDEQSKREYDEYLKDLERENSGDKRTTEQIINDMIEMNRRD